MIKNSQVNFEEQIGLNSLCIDNEDIRRKVTKSTKIEISVVPCILIVYPDGGVEKYEGNTAFQWAEELINKIAPPPPPRPVSPPRVIAPPQPKQAPQQQAPQAPQQQAPQQQAPQQSFGTSIDELDSEEEDENYTSSRPPAPIRSGAGGYDVQGEFGAEEDSNRSVTRGIKSSTEPAVNTGKGLMDIAAAMQKSRENEDRSNVPQGAPANQRP